MTHNCHIRRRPTDVRVPARPWVRWMCGLLAGASLTWLVPAECARSEELVPRLKLAFVSNREHYWYPHVYLYEHDGVDQGRVVAALDPQDKRLDHQPVLTGDGQVCVHGFEHEGQLGQIRWWDVANKQPRELTAVNQGKNTVFSPSLSLDGRWLAYSGWARAGATARWDIFLYDVEHDQMVELPQLNTAKYDERRAALSGDGQWLAYTTNDPEGEGLTDLRVYDRAQQQIAALPGLNSAATDSYPSLSGDGRWLCFASDRETGTGGFDIYLYDRQQAQLVPLPGLNSPGHEQSPNLSRDGRYIAFVSERFEGAGEHDIYVYDRQLQRLLPTPGLNTDRDDYDPHVISVKGEE